MYFTVQVACLRPIWAAMFVFNGCFRRRGLCCAVPFDRRHGPFHEALAEAEHQSKLREKLKEA